MKLARLAAGAVALALGAPPAAAATDWFVATTGTDTPTCGTANAPCKTIQHAIDLTDDGDRVVVGDGTYTECVVVVPGTGPGSVNLTTQTFLTSGSSGAAIIDGAGICDADSDAPGPVVTVGDLSAVSGFAIKNGGRSGVRGLGAVTIVSNLIFNNTTDGSGGGVFLTTGAFLTTSCPGGTCTDSVCVGGANDGQACDPDKSASVSLNTITDNTAAGDGGGVYVDASAAGVASVVTINNNKFNGNSAGTALAVPAHGGGLAVETDTASDTDTSTVNVTLNAFDGNTVKNPTSGGGISTGGGLFVLTGAINGLGIETVTIGGTGGLGNPIRNNESEGLGGGMAIVMAPRNGATDIVAAVGNDISANKGDLGGGGVYVRTIASDLALGANDPSELHLQGNKLIGNFGLGDPADPTTVGGGGLYLDATSLRSPEGVLTLDVSKNQLRGNHTTVFGGGATLSLFANDDPLDDGATAPSAVHLVFENNLIATNDAADAVGMTAFGGGVALFARARGAGSSVTATQRFLTIEANTSDTRAGGVDWNALSEADSIGGSGSVALEISNSIIQANDGFGVGGSVIPGGAITTTVAYNDALDNAPDYDPVLGASAGTDGNISVDPGLDALFVPLLCSITTDAGDPALSPANEPQPNGNRVNIGHLGNSTDAARTLPDLNGDGIVDGLDIMGIAVAFGAFSHPPDPPDPRYIIAADRDLDGMIDGRDLSYVAAFFAQSCTAPGGSTP